MPSDAGPARNEVAVLHPSRLPWNPVFAERYGVDPASWKALVEAVFPGAKTADAVALALSYCKARRLDPFKRVVHIVSTWDEDKGGYVETVWPGIAEHRTTAMRTGLYAGADPAQYGERVEKTFTGRIRSGPVTATVNFPEWCQVTVYRLAGNQRVPVPGPRVYWEETYSAMGRSNVPNQRWVRAPFQMIEKCAEAAALRRAFPEELGDEVTAEEGRHTIDNSAPEPIRGRDLREVKTVQPVRTWAEHLATDRLSHHAPPPDLPDQSELRAPAYEIIDCDGEVHRVATLDQAEAMVMRVMMEAERRGPSHVEAAEENNAALLAEINGPPPNPPADGSPQGELPAANQPAAEPASTPPAGGPKPIFDLPRNATEAHFRRFLDWIDAQLSDGVSGRTLRSLNLVSLDRLKAHDWAAYESAQEKLSA